MQAISHLNRQIDQYFFVEGTAYICERYQHSKKDATIGFQSLKDHRITRGWYTLQAIARADVAVSIFTVSTSMLSEKGF